MVIQDLLIHIDNSMACNKRLEAAIRLAQDHQAHLTGLYVMPPVGYPVHAEVVSAQRALDQARQETLQAIRRRAETARTLFEATIERAGLAALSEWRAVEGELREKLEESVRYTDLVVLGQYHPEDDSDTNRGLADYLVLSAGRPCLVVPYIGTQETLGQRVLVAWNARREAVRAVNDALPILQKAASVIVLAANPPTGDEGDIPSADICHHLARHGVQAEARSTIGSDIDVGDLLLSHAADLGTDMIAMGAYGHSRLRETVLGGVTRYLLHHMTVPVLMSH